MKKLTKTAWAVCDSRDGVFGDITNKRLYIFHDRANARLNKGITGIIRKVRIVLAE